MMDSRHSIPGMCESAVSGGGGLMFPCIYSVRHAVASGFPSITRLSTSREQVITPDLHVCARAAVRSWASRRARLTPGPKRCTVSVTFWYF